MRENSTVLDVVVDTLLHSPDLTPAVKYYPLLPVPPEDGPSCRPSLGIASPADHCPALGLTSYWG